MGAALLTVPGEKSKYYHGNECKDEEKGYRTKVDRIYIQK